jgi:hypothetical protein
VLEKIMPASRDKKQLSGIPVEKLRRHKKQSEKGLDLIQEIDDRDRGASLWWWLLASLIFVFLAIFLRKVLL